MRRCRRRPGPGGMVVLVLLTIVVVPMRAVAQERPVLEVEAVGDLPAFLADISLLLIPKVPSDIWHVREFIRSEAFAEFRLKRGDLAAVDAIYRHALCLSWNNRGEALLISMLATMDHRRVGIRTPLLGASIWLPLTSEFEEDFQARVNALPCRLYPDTPPARSGDRDKLQHFFGSAFIAYTSGSAGPAERTGVFVEWGEERFIVGGLADVRDMRSNLQGATFGMALMENMEALPSVFFRSAPADTATGSRPLWEAP